MHICWPRLPLTSRADGRFVIKCTESHLHHRLIWFRFYFQFPFNASFTSEKPFYSEAGKFLESVPMMYQVGPFPTASIPAINATVLELSYGAEDRLCMLLLLPYSSVHPSTVFEKLAASYSIEMILNEVHRYDLLLREDPGENEVEISLPRFKIKSDFTLNVILEGMGITDLFDVNRADLSKMTQSSTYLSQIIHKTIIEVKEDGTDATADTSDTNAFKHPRSTFNCNRPFGFLIVERLTNRLLYSGLMEKPGQYEIK